MNVSNLSEISEDVYYNSTLLLELNYSRRMFSMPVIIYFILIMVVGFIGNSIVMVIYAFFLPKSPANYFILVLAILDFLSCLIFVPFQIYDMWYPYINSLPTLCRIERFLENMVHLWSGFILVCVASERYVKICTPMHYFGLRQAKTLTFLMFIVSLSLTWPQIIMHGKRTVLIGALKVVGEDCSYSDFFQKSIYLVLYHGLLYFAYFVCCFIFFFFYGNIVWIIIKRKFSVTHSPPNSETTNHNSDTYSKPICLRSVSGRPMRSSKITICLTTVTITAVLSFMPFLTLQTLRAARSAFTETVTPSGEFYHYGSSPQVEYIYMFCMKSYFISIAANPIIYSAMNPEFRNCVAEVFRKLKMKLCNRH